MLPPSVGELAEGVGILLKSALEGGGDGGVGEACGRVVGSGCRGDRAAFGFAAVAAFFGCERAFPEGRAAFFGAGFLLFDDDFAGFAALTDFFDAGFAAFAAFAGLDGFAAGFAAGFFRC